ncbi:MAG: hypothetical protein ABW061_20990 [Polyangiaceae bacterium]
MASPRTFSSAAKRVKRAVAGLALVAGLCASACSQPDEGEVMLVVSTDLALPSDLDRLEWTVTWLSEPGSASQSNGIALDHFNSLPATLAIVSTRNRTERVRVRVSGKIRGAVRVEREAEFSVPDHGQTMLNMPLSWLCSDVNLPEPCAEGFTCDAGACVSTSASAPVDHLLSGSSTCFNVSNCTLTEQGIKETPNLDEDTDTCFLNSNAVLGSEMNVALVVNAAKVGNAGVCVKSSALPSASGNAGSCFVPLSENSGPGGWERTKNAQGQDIIRLPRALCGRVMRASVATVAVTAQSTGCPGKGAIEPSCEAPSVCVLSPASSVSCPVGFPDDTWSGYTCSGAAWPPAQPELGLTYCGALDADSPVEPTLRGRFCCTAGQAASPVQGLIDDMSGGPLIKYRVPAGQVAGSWFTASDDTVRPLSPSQTPHSLFTYRDIPAVQLPDGPLITRAACFRMEKGFSGYYALEGFSFYGKNGEATALNVSQYSGIRFWATLSSFDPDIPQSIRVVFPNQDTDTENRDTEQSTCMQKGLGKANCDHFGKFLGDLGETWREYEVRWTELSQYRKTAEPFSKFDPHVYTVDFQADGPGPDGLALRFDFCVSQIAFIE